MPVPIDSSVANTAPAAGDALAGALPHCVLQRPDGVFVDPAVPAGVFAAAIDSIFSSNRYCSGLNYPVLLKVIYGYGPDLPRSASGEMMIRFADEVLPFDPLRRQLSSLRICGAKEFASASILPPCAMQSAWAR
jgi:hypothetical protein